MKGDRQLLNHVQAFFSDYLGVHRGLSPNTIAAYRDAIKLFLSFVACDKKRGIAAVTLDDLDADAVLAFLEHGENERGNGIVTRNLRLSALRTFFSYLASRDVMRSGQYQKAIAIPAKKAPHPRMEYLELHEVRALIESIDREGALGRRDYVLLILLYNTGARAQEICDLRVGDVRLEPPPLVIITGKGRKKRTVPLWPDTAALLGAYMAERGLGGDPDRELFANARGEPLSRFGLRHIVNSRTSAAAARCPSLAKKSVSPHTFRHTTAMHMLQSGVELTVIKSWLGHVKLSTTHAYIEIDLDMKRKALSACVPIGSPEGLRKFIDQNEDVIRWLESL